MAKRKAQGGEVDKEKKKTGTSLDRTASWVLRNKHDKKVVMETYDPKKVAALNTEKYEAVPIHDYLGEFNRGVENGENRGGKVDLGRAHEGKSKKRADRKGRH